MRYWPWAVMLWMVHSTYWTARLDREVRRLKSERPDYKVIISGPEVDR
jgi:hypothetical protein